MIARNINLDRYMKLKEDKERIEKATDKYLLRKQKKTGSGKYKIPEGLEDIEALKKTVIPMKELRTEFEQLLKESEEKKLSEHIDLHENNSPFIKSLHYFRLDAETKKLVNRWFRRFNTIRNEIELRTK